MEKYLKLFEYHSQYEDFVSGGTMVKPNVSHCVQENEVHYNPKYNHDYTKDYFTIESLEDSNTIYLKASRTLEIKTVSASTDNGETWTEYKSSKDGSGTTLATLNTGDKLLVKGENTEYGSSAGFNQFKSTKQFEVNGNIMSLISGDSFANADELTGTYTFKSLYNGCTGLTSAENLALPATTLANYCCREMFNGCTSLTTAPSVLPATTLANYCYYQMFKNCTSLTIAPELPATTLASNCYQEMFNGCTSLTTAPELSATSLTTNCYSNMFYGCTNLTVAPELPAATLASNCYDGMFRGCTSLTTAPELPATTLASYCYRSMFYGCTSLTTAPELPVETLAEGCYNSMFSNCTNLNYIKCLATASATDSTTNWVSGVASTGIFVKNSAATWDVTGVDGIPTGWAVQDATA